MLQKTLRKEINVNVMKMGTDQRTRISAMSDWVRSHVHINPEGSEDYTQFIADVLDYNEQTADESAGASVVLSGLARYIVRNM